MTKPDPKTQDLIIENVSSEYVALFNTLVDMSSCGYKATGDENYLWENLNEEEQKFNLADTFELMVRIFALEKHGSVQFNAMISEYRREQLTLARDVIENNTVLEPNN